MRDASFIYRCVCSGGGQCSFKGGQNFLVIYWVGEKGV